MGAGLCVLGFSLFKAKYFAWVLTLILMFVAIVIDVLGLGFVGGSFTNDPNNEGIMSGEFAYVLITVSTSLQLTTGKPYRHKILADL